jgi:hypothetical protein
MASPISDQPRKIKKQESNAHITAIRHPESIAACMNSS